MINAVQSHFFESRDEKSFRWILEGREAFRGAFRPLSWESSGLNSSFINRRVTIKVNRKPSITFDM
jgi:hypothetical protein